MQASTAATVQQACIQNANNIRQLLCRLVVAMRQPGTRQNLWALSLLQVLNMRVNAGPPTLGGMTCCRVVPSWMGTDMGRALSMGVSPIAEATTSLEASSLAVAMRRWFSVLISSGPYRSSSAARPACDMCLAQSAADWVRWLAESSVVRQKMMGTAHWGARLAAQACLMDPFSILS